MVNYAADMLQVMINVRHQDGLHAANNLELVATDLHIAVNAVGEVVGKPPPRIFLTLFSASFASENNAHFPSDH